MRAEAHEEANAVLDRHAARISSITGVMPERVIREGDKAEEMLKLIDEDEDIAALILAAGTGKEGPGPAGLEPRQDRRRRSRSRSRIVPGHLSDEDLDSMS